MDDRRSPADRLAGIEGADDGALGTSRPPESAPPGAQVEGEQHLVPGANHEDRPIRESKPWFTTLAAESEQAGVANDPPEAKEPKYVPADEDEDTAPD